MDRTVRRVCDMLQSPDGMRRCAAAMVLAELAPKDAAVVKALGTALKDANQLLTRYVLGFPPACDPQNPVLLSAYAQGIENGHWPSLAGECPDNPGDPGALPVSQSGSLKVHRSRLRWARCGVDGT